MTKTKTSDSVDAALAADDQLTAAVTNLRAVMDNARMFHRPPGLLLDEIDQAVKGIEAALKPAE